MFQNELNPSSVNREDFGLVTSVKDGVVSISGLWAAMAGELILINQAVEGVVLNVEDSSIKAIIFDTDDQVEEGFWCERTETILNVPTGVELLGRVVDSLGNPIDDLEDIEVEEEDFVDVEIKVPGIISRKSVHQPMQTGTTSSDVTVSVWCGQSELVIGDRQTGKTTIAVDTILNHLDIYGWANLPYWVYVEISMRNLTVDQISTLIAHRWTLMLYQNYSFAEISVMGSIGVHTACGLAVANSVIHKQINAMWLSIYAIHIGRVLEAQAFKNTPSLWRKIVVWFNRKEALIRGSVALSTYFLIWGLGLYSMLDWSDSLDWCIPVLAGGTLVTTLSAASTLTWGCSKRGMWPASVLAMAVRLVSMPITFKLPCLMPLIDYVILVLEGAHLVGRGGSLAMLTGLINHAQAMKASFQSSVRPSTSRVASVSRRFSTAWKPPVASTGHTFVTAAGVKLHVPTITDLLRYERNGFSDLSDVEWTQKIPDTSCFPQEVLEAQEKLAEALASGDESKVAVVITHYSRQLNAGLSWDKMSPYLVKKAAPRIWGYGLASKFDANKAILLQGYSDKHVGELLGSGPGINAEFHVDVAAGDPKPIFNGCQAWDTWKKKHLGHGDSAKLKLAPEVNGNNLNNKMMDGTVKTTTTSYKTSGRSELSRISSDHKPSVNATFDQTITPNPAKWGCDGNMARKDHNLVGEELLKVQVSKESVEHNAKALQPHYDQIDGYDHAQPIVRETLKSHPDCVTKPKKGEYRVVKSLKAKQSELVYKRD